MLPISRAMHLPLSFEASAAGPKDCGPSASTISSVAGFAPLHRRTAYSASKHALEGFFRTLREEEREHGVAVLIAAPSFIGTNIGRPEQREGGIARPGSAPDGVDYMEPEAAARIIMAGLAARRSFIPVGRVARLAWIINRLSPRLFARLMMRNVRKKGKATGAG